MYLLFFLPGRQRLPSRHGLTGRVVFPLKRTSHLQLHRLTKKLIDCFSLNVVGLAIKVLINRLIYLCGGKKRNKVNSANVSTSYLFNYVQLHFPFAPAALARGTTGTACAKNDLEANYLLVYLLVSQLPFQCCFSPVASVRCYVIN